MTIRRTTALSAALSAVVLAAGLGTGIAVAEPPAASPEPFGQHVRACAQDTGFDGSHNPGMHHGASGHHGGDHHC